MASQQVESFVAQRAADFWMNALIGAVVTILTSFVPLSPILGGGVAGYLQHGSRMAGAKVGAVSALLAAIPVYAVVTLMFGGMGFLAIVDGGTAGAAVFWAFVIFALLATAVVMAVMGALGGYLGALLHERNDPIPEGTTAST